jgi:hypothetical protein
MGVLAALLGTFPAMGQARQPAETLPTLSTPVLAGPRVGGARAGDTLVKRDFNGEVVPLEVSPEEAALALLDMSREERAAAQRVINERAAVMDEAMGGNIPLLLKVQGLSAALASDRVRIIREVSAAMRPLRERGTLQDELSRVLSPVHAAEVKRLCGEYEEALIAQRVAQASEQGTRMNRTQAQATERLYAVGHEVRRSYERVTSERSARLEELIDSLNLKGDQEERIRRILMDGFQESLGKPTAAQKRERFVKVLSVLDDRQRRELMSRAAPSMSATTPTQPKAPAPRDRMK